MKQSTINHALGQYLKLRKVGGSRRRGRNASDMFFAMLGAAMARDPLAMVHTGASVDHHEMAGVGVDMVFIDDPIDATVQTGTPEQRAEWYRRVSEATFGPIFSAEGDSK